MYFTLVNLEDLAETFLLLLTFVALFSNLVKRLMKVKTDLYKAFRHLRLCLRDARINFTHTIRKFPSNTLKIYQG